MNDAVNALQPFYEAGEDGYAVSLALDALAGILGDKAGVDVDDEKALPSILRELGAPRDLVARIGKLYKNAAGGEYGAGLSEKQAKVVNNLVQEVVDPLVEFIEAFRPTKAGRKHRRSPRKNP